MNREQLAEYVDRTAAFIGLPLDPEHRPGVIENLERSARIAELFLEFPLPDTIEAAAIFRPEAGLEPGEIL
ncbi:MAG: DUF4089 domain-containing protein [Coleofasciculaceae cyanobacterium SM2_3_26]|nr:DUF4089 domain-containing protein [Coleofasciculaceae cyanobacterium SM2_3_26]